MGPSTHLEGLQILGEGEGISRGLCQASFGFNALTLGGFSVMRKGLLTILQLEVNCLPPSLLPSFACVLSSLSAISTNLDRGSLWDTATNS